MAGFASRTAMPGNRETRRRRRRLGGQAPRVGFGDAPAARPRRDTRDRPSVSRSCFGAPPVAGSKASTSTWAASTSASVRDADPETAELRELRRIDAGTARRIVGHNRRRDRETEHEKEDESVSHVHLGARFSIALPEYGTCNPARQLSDDPAGHSIPSPRTGRNSTASGARVAVMIGEYLRDLPAQPVDRVVPADVRQRLMSLPLPGRGQTPQEILDFLGREIMPWPVAIGHRGPMPGSIRRRRRFQSWPTRSRPR